MNVESSRYGGGAGRHEPELEHARETRELTSARARTPWPVARHCSTEFRAIRTSGTRRLSAIGLGVVHCTQGSTARGAASWFTNPDCKGSAHVIVDELECYRTLAPSVIPWAAPGTNGRGWHLELAGFARWTRSEWLAHRGTLERGAYKMALHAGEYGFPLVHLSDAQLRAGREGLIGHVQASRVFGGDHTDPGAGFPWDVFLKLCRGYADGLGL